MGDMEDKKDDRGFDSHIPIWDGRPDTLREFRKMVNWWLHSIDLEKTKGYNLAARFAMRQRGSAKLRALEFDPKELEYTPAVTRPDLSGGEVVVTPAVYEAGILKILDAWDEMIGRSVTDKKGELRERFYLNLRRGGTESVAAFGLRYRTIIGEMKAEGITIDPGEQAWFYKQKLQLTELQRQMLETTLGSNTEDYGACERESVRLFKRIHSVGVFRPGFGGLGASPKRSNLTSGALARFKRFTPGSRSSPSSTSTPGGSRSSGRAPARTAYIAETEEDMVDDYEGDINETVEDEYDEGENDEFVVLQDALEVLAAELDEVAEEGHGDEEVAGLEDQIGQAVETLVTLREARTRINNLKKDRGYKGSGKAGSKGKSPSKGGDKGKKPKDGVCFDCGLPGHWAGGPECRNPKSPPKLPSPKKMKP